MYKRQPEYDRIVLRKSDTLAGLETAAETEIWHKHESGPQSIHISVSYTHLDVYKRQLFISVVFLRTYFYHKALHKYIITQISK